MAIETDAARYLRAREAGTLRTVAVGAPSGVDGRTVHSMAPARTMPDALTRFLASRGLMPKGAAGPDIPGPQVETSRPGVPTIEGGGDGDTLAGDWFAETLAQLGASGTSGGGTSVAPTVSIPPQSAAGSGIMRGNTIVWLGLAAGAYLAWRKWGR